jgi:hypothetical protein
MNGGGRMLRAGHNHVSARLWILVNVEVANQHVLDKRAFCEQIFGSMLGYGPVGPGVCPHRVVCCTVANPPTTSEHPTATIPTEVPANLAD